MGGADARVVVNCRRTRSLRRSVSAAASGAALADLAAVAHAAHRLDGQDEAHGAAEGALGVERTRADPPPPPEARAASTRMDGLRGSLDRGPAARHSDSS